MDEKISLGLSDRSFFKQISIKMAKFKKPFMAFLMTLSTHVPYVLPEKERKLKIENYENTLLGKYFQCVSYIDTVLSEFFFELSSEGLLKDSVIAIYGDHKPYLIQSEFCKFMGLKTTSLDFTYWLSLNKLPFFIYLPGGKICELHSEPVGHIDVSSILLNILGIENTMSIPAIQDLVVFRDGSFVFKDIAYIKTLKSHDKAVFYNINSKERMSFEGFLKNKKMAKECLNISDKVIKGNLIRKIK